LPPTLAPSSVSSVIPTTIPSEQQVASLLPTLEPSYEPTTSKCIFYLFLSIS
jgi:hypothetical protein